MKSNLRIFLIFLFVIFSNTESLASNDLFMQATGASGSELSYSIKQTSDGGYILSKPL